MNSDRFDRLVREHSSRPIREEEEDDTLLTYEGDYADYDEVVDTLLPILRKGKLSINRDGELEVKTRGHDFVFDLFATGDGRFTIFNRGSKNKERWEWRDDGFIRFWD